MKKIHIFFALSLAAVLTIQTAYSQTKYEKPQLENKDSWSLIMVPDLQNYVKWNRNQPILDLMMSWIEDNVDSLNIKMVICVGDLVEHDDIINPGHDGDQPSQSQWNAVSRAFSKLNGKVPYIAATGNHDYSIDRKGFRTSRYDEFFNISTNWMNKKYLVQNSKNEAGKPTLENSAYEIKSLNGQDYLFMTIEFAPRDTVLTWARRVAEMPEYKNHRIILSTHAYLNAKDERTKGEMKWFTYEPYSLNNIIQKGPMVKLPFSNNGQQIWEKLVMPSSNIEMVLSGHISGEGYKMDKNTSGRAVHQILFDAQSMGGGHRNGNGGDGWLRILEFFPDNKTVKVKTFSPLFGISPTSQPHAWKKDKRNEFKMELGNK